MQTKNKRRGSGFRYSNKKDLERSKVKRRTVKAGGSKLASVTKALLYSKALSSGCAVGSGGPHCLDILEEYDGDGIELSIQSFYNYEGNEMSEDMCSNIPSRWVWVGVSLIPFYADNAIDGLVSLLNDLNCPFWLLDSNAISHPLWYVTRG